MKNKFVYIALFYLLFAASACVTSPPQRGTTVTTPMSVEAEAKKKTDQQKTLLGLSTDQYDKVMVINTTHLKIIKNLKQNNETDKLPAADESYKKQMGTVLSPDQYTVFLANF